VIWTLSLAVFAASFVAGLSGFGLGLIAMSVLPLLISIKLANPLVSILAAAIFGGLSIPLRRSIDWKAAGRLLAGAAVGTPIGIYGLVALDERVLLVGMGIFILVYVAYALLFQERLRPRLDLRWGYLAGLIGGTIGGALSVGGPPIVIYCTALDLDKRSLKATIQAYFAALMLYKFPMFWASGLLTAALGRLLAVAAPFAAAGTILGLLAFRHLSDRWFRRVVLGLLVVAAVLLLVKN
jgi:uncharacterized membrane protein YfcA